MDKDHYLNKINVLDWLTNDKYQVIRFRDRIEYRKNNQLNRIDGPAIDYFSENESNLYYYNGKKLTSDEFNILSKTKKMKQL